MINFLKRQFQQQEKSGNFNRIFRYSKEGFWIILGQLLAVIGSLVGVRFMTTFLAPDQFGVLSLALTIGTLVNLMVFGPISQGVMRFYSIATEKKETGSYLAAVKILTKNIFLGIVIFSILTFIIFIIFNKVYLGVLVLFSLIFAIISGFNTIINSIQNAARQRIIVAIHQGIGSWIKYFLAIIIMFFFGRTSLIALFGYALAILMILISQFYFLKKVILKSIEIISYKKDYIKPIISYSLPFVYWAIFVWGQQVSDKWALQVFSSTYEVGLYAVLFQLGYYPMTLLNGLVIQLLTPIFFEKVGDTSCKKRVKKVTKSIIIITMFSLILTFFLFLFAIIFHNLIFRILVDSRYLSISYLFPWLLLSGGLFSTGQIFSLVQHNKTSTKSLIMPKIITAIIGVCLNFYGAYLWGIKGIVIASIIFSVIYFVWMIFLAIKDASICYEFDKA